MLKDIRLGLVFVTLASSSLAYYTTFNSGAIGFNMTMLDSETV